MPRIVIPWIAAAVGVSTIAVVLAVQHGRDPVAAVLPALVVLSSGPVGLVIRRRREMGSRSAAPGSVERAIASATQAAVFRDLLVGIPAAMLFQLVQPERPPITTFLLLLVAVLADHGLRNIARLRACGRPGTGTNDLAVHRAAAGLAPEDLALATGVSDRTIVAIENGRHEPGVDLALALARELGVRVEDLFPAHPPRA
ncbi:helix-turn-helix transcriptional regulator [Clavibacter tessellarius]|uniref:helix-turn-helix transcriptional regulator n=1 Tax=Clavibacter tessellarius TaxID=31965 RepID=UPI0020C7CE09|nr:helix-turn-helix transcriptional regulator [Clavibacter michiganensis]